MTLTTLLLILLLFAVTLLSGVGALVLLRHHPAWSVPVTGALTVRGGVHHTDRVRRSGAAVRGPQEPSAVDQPCW
ncbi:hypothetical protein [Streptomyces sp. SP2-10]|uniref:hypothetical protein n=1 Tax=Streptomyces sp. SP2-10 TaxID=2873385 RepID=UPI001CA6BD0F|nr:hypothetical protein [Streptomyces sp. SP2-10]MBY8846229.1 hypothetical protein [Streptomyces sp. SP2-10]